MVRTQIQLTEDQARQLKAAAAVRGVSMAQLIREAVDQALIASSDDARWRLALTAVGAFRSDGADVAVNHDKYLAEAFDDALR
jgi:uncharacterized protein with von Willebrand factor type A (vWA) domain